MRILVVEDNLGDAKLLEYLDTGYDLDFARTLREAESKISRVNYQCIILDLHLPDSSGSETVFKVKEFAPKIPIIVLTGMEDGGKIEKEVAEHVHISAFLKKGEITKQTLTMSVAYCLMEEIRKMTSSVLDKMLYAEKFKK